MPLAVSHGSTPSRAQKPLTVTNRRGCFGSLAALATGGIAVGAVAASVHPDARLIALCGEYMRVVTAYNADGGNLEFEVDPLWHAIKVVEDQLEDLPAQTIEGIFAKARVALFQAQLPDGREDFSDSYTGDWPEQVVRDLLRLHGGAA